jgi:hypothetical protein
MSQQNAPLGFDSFATQLAQHDHLLQQVLYERQTSPEPIE